MCPTQISMGNNVSPDSAAQVWILLFPQTHRPLPPCMCTEDIYILYFLYFHLTWDLNTTSPACETQSEDDPETFREKEKWECSWTWFCSGRVDPTLQVREGTVRLSHSMWSRMHCSCMCVQQKRLFAAWVMQEIFFQFSVYFQDRKCRESRTRQISFVRVKLWWVFRPHRCLPLYISRGGTGA